MNDELEKNSVFHKQDIFFGPCAAVGLLAFLSGVQLLNLLNFFFFCGKGA